KDQIPDWSAVFRRWRETTILAAGAGLSYRVMVRNLLRSGVRHLLLALDASDDPAADRSAVTASVAEAAGRDREIVVEWLDPASAPTDAAAGGVRIVYVSDAVPMAEDSLLRRLIALDWPGTLAGGIVRGSALVGPELGDGVPLLSTWDRFSAGEPTLPYSRAARAILGSVVAFEALKSLTFDKSSEPDQRGWLQRHCYHVRPDTDIEVHGLSPANVGPAGAPVAAEAVTPEPDDDPLFDPVTGSLGWDDFDGAEFPLPHRAIAIRPEAANGGPGPDPVTQWALTPQELDERTTARALESLAEADLPAVAAPSGCSSSPVVAARDEAAWREQARAHAIARHAAFLSAIAPVRIDPDSVADQDARMLFRLVRLYTGAVPQIWLLGGTGWGASVACVAVGGQLSRSAAATPARAIVEALGDALSALQAGRRPGRQRQPFLGPLDGIRPVEGLEPMALDRIGGPGSLALRFDEIRLFPGGVASRGWVVGRVQACL
ncbi:MAG TPA: hypothetical protein VMS43_04170, partial [Allosphingosinicella sp.]|nr:hypothetical protein [Allosphingosinicella sp.]